MWNLEGNDVTWQVGAVRGTWSPALPGAGFQQTIAGQCFPELAQVAFDTWRQVPPGLPDLYTRQGDLIATYQQSSGDALRTQLQWSLLDRPFGTGLDLLVSVQTDRWHSHPAACIGSRLPTGAQVFRLDATHPTVCRPYADELRAASSQVETGGTDLIPGCVLIRLASQYSYVEMIHPADCRPNSSDSFRLRQELATLRTEFGVLGEPLEKGVIRRVRWRSIWLPRESDTQRAHDAYRDFLQRPLPLTT